MPQEIGEVYKSLIPTLSDDASIETALKMYHYGTATYNGNNLQPNSIEKHFKNINAELIDVRQVIASLNNVYIEQVSSASASNLITPQDATVVPLTIRGFLNQSANLQVWQKDSGLPITVAAISNNGAASFAGYVTIGSNAFSSTTALPISIANNTHRGITVRAASEQTANLQEWQNNNGSSVASISAGGNFSAQAIVSQGNFTVNGATSVVNALTVNNGITINGGVTLASGTTLSLTGNLTSTVDISARKITLTGTGSGAADSISAAGSVTISGNLTANGTLSTIKKLKVTETIEGSGDISTTGKVTVGTGGFVGPSASITGNVATTTLTATGNISVSTGNSVGAGIIFANKGDIVDLNDGYAAMRFTNGVRIHAGNKTGAARIALNSTGVINAAGEIQSTASNAFRMVQGNFGSFFRNDGTSTYLLLTNSGDQYGTFNALRPLTINNSSGILTTTSPTADNSYGVRNIYISSGPPAGGASGDIWIQWTA